MKMNKSKFKTVKFLPLDLELHYQTDGAGKEVWTNYFAFGHSLMNNVYFTDSCIKAYPELFEVEKAEREFEHKAYYKVKMSFDCEYFEPAQYDGHTKVFYVINSEKKYLQRQIFEIGEKIEL